MWVVTESVFSMDGDYPDLKKLAALKAVRQALDPGRILNPRVLF